MNDAFLQAAARLFERPIVVIAETTDGGIKEEVEYEAKFNTNVKKLDTDIIYLHHTGIHFNFLLHKDQE